MTMLLLLLGFAALASAMHATPRPCRLPDGSRARHAARIAGTLSVFLSILTALSGRPIGYAIVGWCGLATISAALILLLLTAVRVAVRRNY